MKINRISVLRQIKGYALPLKGPILMLVLISAAAIPVALISPRFFQILLDDVLAKKSMEQFGVVVFGLLGVYLIRFILDGGNLFFGNRLLNTFTLKLRSDVFGKYQSAPYAFLEQKDIGDLKMRVMDDVDSLGSFIQSQVVAYFFSLLMIVFSLAMCLRINWQMTLYCLAIIPIVFLINWLIGHGTKKVNEDIRRVNEEYYTSTHNSLQFWREIKAQNAEQTFIDRFKHYRVVLAKLGLRSIRYWAFSEIFNDFKANYLTRVLVYIAGAFFVIRGQLTVGVLIMFAEYFAMLFGALDTVNNKNVELRVNAPYYKRVFETLDFPQESSFHETGDRKKREVNISGDITVSNLGFGYREGQTVLSNVNFAVTGGETIAVIGKTGCGKTTLAKLLLGLYEPEKGDIFYDGVPLAEIDKESLYAQIGVVMQDSFLFDMTIRENLMLAKADADENELSAACARANILNFIRSLPGGFDTVIGERGVKLSGGQKQRLCIARVLLKQPGVIIFDEATSALDRESEDIINASINEIARDTTVIVIAHKPATVLRAKRVVVMEDGKIIDAGTHDELAVRNEFYKKLAG